MNASELKTVEHIRASYTAKEENKLDELKALNEKVKRPANIFSYIFGTIGTLVLGTGMCFAMGVIGSSMLLGIGIGLGGIAMVSVNYPINRAILSGRKAKYADRVLTLSDELLKREVESNV